ncbi:MAG TPA: NAD(P)-dependent oxidoreductase [Streptosporangiaceae bacterium]
MRVLVTGSTGRVGSRFVPRLLEQGEDVRVLVRDAAKAEALRERGAEVVTGDLRDPDDVRKALAGRDAVVHVAAAFRHVPDEEAVAVNRDATVGLAREALSAGVSRFVFTSTTLVYGPGRGRPAAEGDEPRPARAYPVSKVAAEQALQAMYVDEGLGLRVMRLGFVYGEGDPHLAEAMMFARGRPAHMRFQLVHHADVGQALIRGLRADGVDGRIYNVADDAPITVWEVHRLNGEQIAPDAAGLALDDPWEGIADTAKIRTELGFRPLYPSVYTARDAGAL